MSAKVLLDTDILSEVLKGANPIVAERSRRYLRDHSVLKLA